MPNTLAHMGIQAIASRAVIRDADLRWVFIGCVVPDVPWVLNRVLANLIPGLDVFVVRPYWIAQASLLGSLWLCGALALTSVRPGRTFALLAGNAAAHLLFDALQTKWGNGVHLLAPFSWHTWNVGWFWPESDVTWLFTALGAAVAFFAAFDVWRNATLRYRPTLARWLGVIALLAVYGVYPLAMRDAVMASDAHSLQTLRHPELRAGRQAGFDRVWLEVEGSSGRLHVLGGEVISATGNLETASGPISARGRFVDADTIILEDVHPHGLFPRELASYLGLTAIAGILALGWATSRPGSAAAGGEGEASRGP